MNCAQTTTTATTIYGRKHSMNNWSIGKAFDDYFRPTRRVQTYDELSQLLKWFRIVHIVTLKGLNVWACFCWFAVLAPSSVRI